MADARQLADLIGVPFAYGGRGPDTFDCYGLLREIYRRRGFDIPDYLSPSDGGRITALFACELRLWEPVDPQPGAAILIRVPGNTHVGYQLDPSRMLHTWEKSGGVVIERLDTWRHKIKGFYRYVG